MTLWTVKTEEWMKYKTVEFTYSRGGLCFWSNVLEMESATFIQTSDWEVLR